VPLVRDEVVGRIEELQAPETQGQAGGNSLCGSRQGIGVRANEARDGDVNRRGRDTLRKRDRRNAAVIVGVTMRWFSLMSSSSSTSRLLKQARNA
jgi:hypothetical protein